jgi:hypothetical protein
VSDDQLSYYDRLAGGRTAQELWACGLNRDHVDEARLARVIDMLAPKQADLIELALKNVPQSSMAAFFCVTQPAISIALKRAIKAVKTLLTLPDISEQSIVRDLTPHLPPELVEVLRVQFRTGNYSWTAQATKQAGTLKVARATVRRKVIRAVRLLQSVEGAEDYVTFFGAMLDSTVTWAHTRSGRLNGEQLRARETARALKAVDELRLKPSSVSG